MAKQYYTKLEQMALNIDKIATRKLMQSYSKNEIKADSYNSLLIAILIGVKL